MDQPQKNYYTTNGKMIGGMNEAFYQPYAGYAGVTNFVGSTVKQRFLDAHQQTLRQRIGIIDHIFRPLDNSLLYVEPSCFPHDFAYWQIPQVHHAAQDFHTKAHRILKTSDFQQTLENAKKRQPDFEKLLGFHIPKAAFDPFKSYLHTHLFGAFSGKINDNAISISIEVTLDRYAEYPISASISFQCPEDIIATRNCCSSYPRRYGRLFSTTNFNTQSDDIRQKAFFISAYALHMQTSASFDGVLRPEQVPTLFSMFRDFQTDPEINKLLLQSAYYWNFQAEGYLQEGPIYPFDRRNAIKTAIHFHDQTLSSLRNRWHAQHYV